MKTGEKTLVCLLGGFLLANSASALTAGNPYQSAIVDRNVFGLKSPPPPPDPSESKKDPPVNLTLTGITTILGNKRVLMKSAPQPGKPGEAAKELSYILTEGQRDGEVEVLTIDEVRGAVKVRNAGVELTLTFEKNGSKLPATQAPAAPPPNVPTLPGAIPARPAGAPPMPAATPALFNSGASPGDNSALPNRALRVSPSAIPTGAPNPGFGTPGAYNSGAVNPGLGGAANAHAGGVTLPSFVGSAPASGITESRVAVPENVMSPEEQMILIETRRASGDPFAAMLPPTPLNPNANVHNPGAEAGQGTQGQQTGQGQNQPGYR